MGIIYAIGTLVIIICALVLPRILMNAHPIRPYNGLAPAQQAYNGATAQFTTAYASPDDHFTVRFPSYPTTDSSNVPINGTTVTTRSYTVSDSNTSYSVHVIPYPASIDMSDKDARLKAALDGAAKAVGGTIASSKFETFAGNRALEASVSTTQGGKTTSNYSLYFLKGNTLYSLVAIGVNQNDFDAFKLTFHLTV
ncbi:MAG TPA: hypothetical protein VLF71_03775 [Candidatus Saccharimonadales bacterium]|nr:hypothetical protein [Candidatus Saccharimonadales bacterium]